MRKLLVAATLLITASPLASAESCATLDSKGVAALFDDWNFALSSLDASQVVQRYWPNAVLLPTVPNTPRTNSAMINDYFEHFLAKRPRGRIDTRTVQSGCNLAMDVGTYTFSLMNAKGSTTEVAARYSFVYQYREGGWKILHHHSSAMPETSGSAASTPVVAVHTTPAPEPKAAPAPALVTVNVPEATPDRPKSIAKDARKPVSVATTASKPATAAPTAPAAAPAAPAAPPKIEPRTMMFANLVASPPPSKFYPPEANKRKERGSVNLKVCADDKGAVAGTPEIVKSSGSKLLDEAAQSWARAAKWVPATLNHIRVESCTQIDVDFGGAA